jgi:hypothetical protein
MERDSAYWGMTNMTRLINPEMLRRWYQEFLEIVVRVWVMVHETEDGMIEGHIHTFSFIMD